MKAGEHFEKKPNFSLPKNLVFWTEILSLLIQEGGYRKLLQNRIYAPFTYSPYAFLYKNEIFTMSLIDPVNTRRCLDVDATLFEHNIMGV